MSKPQTMIAGPLVDEGILAALSVDPHKLVTVGNCYEFVAERVKGKAVLQVRRVQLTDGTLVLQLWHEDTPLGEQHRDYLARLFGRVGTYHEM